MNSLSTTTVLKSMIALLSLFIVFHLLIVAGLIPFHIVWGGRLKTHEEMLRMELVSIILNLLMLGTAFVRLRYFILPSQPKVMRIIFGLMFLLFTLNTLGNLMAETFFEKAVFTPVTLLLALFCLKVALDKTN